MREYINLVESLDDWSGDWIHFSKEPHISINPKPFHQDPSGVYFFPEKFSPIGMWTKYPYKFRAQIKPGTRILDLSTVTQEQIEELVDRAGCRASYDEYIDRYPPSDMHKRVKMAWEMMVRHFAWEWKGTRQNAAFNKLFRDAGWDAIFDDTKSIHSAEIQLLVLDPRCIKVLSLDQAKGSGFAEVEMVAKMVAKLCQSYGTVTVARPKRYNRRSWGTPVNGIESIVRVEGADEQWLELKVYGEPDERSHTKVPSEIHVSKNSSSSYKIGTGSATYEIATGEWSWSKLRNIEEMLNTLFAREPEMA